MLTCNKLYEDIPFAHRQFRHKGHCAHIHGHNWSFDLTFAADTTDENGFVVDFGKLQPLKEFFRQFDHALVLIEGDPMLPVLTDLLKTFNCDNIITLRDGSCEGLAKHVFEETNTICRRCFERRNVHVVAVTVYEDGHNSASYDGAEVDDEDE